MFGYSFAEFMNLELPNITDEEESHANNPSKYLLFNDPLLGLFDYTIHDGLKDRYKAAIPVLEKSINGRQYDYLFDFYVILEKVLCKANKVTRRWFIREAKELDFFGTKLGDFLKTSSTHLDWDKIREDYKNRRNLL